MEYKVDEYAKFGIKHTRVSNTVRQLDAAEYQLGELRPIQKGLPKGKYRDRIDEEIRKLHYKIAGLKEKIG